MSSLALREVAPWPNSDNKFHSLCRTVPGSSPPRASSAPLCLAPAALPQRLQLTQVPARRLGGFSLRSGSCQNLARPTMQTCSRDRPAQRGGQSRLSLQPVVTAETTAATHVGLSAGWAPVRAVGFLPWSSMSSRAVPLPGWVQDSHPGLLA